RRRRSPVPSAAAPAGSRVPSDVGDGDEEDQGEDEHEPSVMDGELALRPQGAAADRLERDEDEATAVEKGNRKQVDDAEVDAYEADPEEQGLPALFGGLVGGLGDADRPPQPVRPGEAAASRRVHHPVEAGEDVCDLTG